MEHSHRWPHFVPLRRLSERVREISRNASHRRRAQGLALLLSSLTFGFWAHEAARKQATQSWLKSHPPSGAIWKHALQSQGYRLLEKPGQVHRALRSLPSQADDVHAVWMDPQGHWVAIFEPRADRLIPWLYCLECAAPPPAWQRLGTRWDAFERALPLSEQARERLKSQVKPQKTSVARDPRQIDY